ncbi:MAG: class I SAM-dependent methyltransferase [Nanoarchaeota archaeon]|nr:class I SAM-dependent methyltransferase [Nanoarchaeota archaeon]
MKQQQLYRKVANSYDLLLKVVGYNDFLKYVINKKISLNMKNPKILDVGCGTGLSTKIIKNKFETADITCLDFSKEMIGLCISKIKDANYIIGDFNERDSFRNIRTKKARLENESFDLILSASAISEYGNQESLAIIYSLLKDEKIFLNIGVRKNFVNIVTGNLWRYKAQGTKNFKRKCEKARFRDVKEIRIPLKKFYLKYRYFVVVARK